MFTVDIAGYWRQIALQRPFSRQLRLSTREIINEADRTRFLRSLGPIRSAFELQMVLRFLAIAYAGRYGEADALLRQMSAADREGYRQLFRATDLRKFILACFRDYLQLHPRLPDEMAVRLYCFSRLFDDVGSSLTPETRETASSISDRLQPLLFEQATHLPGYLTVKILCKKHYYGPGSRLHDIGLRIATAFESAGARCHVVDPVLDHHDFDPYDLILVDDEYLERYACNRDLKRKAELMGRLRKSAKRLALIDFDPWSNRWRDGAHLQDVYDFAWAMIPSLIRDGRLNGVPICAVPFPVGFPALFQGLSSNAPIREIGFCGGVEEFNHSRYLWLLGSQSFSRKVSYSVTKHDADGLTVEESLRIYLSKLTTTAACLNFTKMIGPHRVVQVEC